MGAGGARRALLCLDPTQLQGVLSGLPTYHEEDAVGLSQGRRLNQKPQTQWDPEHSRRPGSQRWPQLLQETQGPQSLQRSVL